MAVLQFNGRTSSKKRYFPQVFPSKSDCIHLYYDKMLCVAKPLLFRPTSATATLFAAFIA